MWLFSEKKLHFFKQMGFTPYQAEKPLRGMKLQEKEEKKD